MADVVKIEGIAKEQKKTWGELAHQIDANFDAKVGRHHIKDGYLLSFRSDKELGEYLDKEDASLLIEPPLKLPEGGGGSGGTTSDVFTIYGINSMQYYIKGKREITLKFKARNTINDVEEGEINVTVLLGERVLFNKMNCTPDAQGFYIATVQGSDLKNIANTYDTVTLRITRATDDSRIDRKNINVYCANLHLDTVDGFNFGEVNRTSIVYVPAFTVIGGNSIKLVVNIYKSNGELFSTPIITAVPVTNNKFTVNINWTNAESGVYIAKAHLDMGNGLVQSPEVETQLLRVAPGDEQNVSLIAIQPLKEAVLYDDVTIPFTVYHRGSTNITARLQLNETITEVTTTSGEVFRNFTSLVDKTENKFSVSIIDGGSVVTKTISFEAAGKEGFNWKTIEGYVTNLTAKGRSNSEVNPADWGGVTEFTNVEFNDSSSGWINGKLHLTGKGKATVKVHPFYDQTTYNETSKLGGGILSTGRTVRVRWKVSNVGDPSLPVISCWDNRVGFYITGDTIYVNVGGEITTAPTAPQANKNDRHYSPDEENELCITVQPYWNTEKVETQHIVTMYINGQFAGDVILKQQSLSQDTETPITIHANGCNVDVSQLTIYNKCLDSFEVLQNNVMSKESLDDMYAAFKKEQCYTGNGTVSLNETFRYCLEISAAAGNSVDGTLSICINSHTFEPSLSDTGVYPNTEQELGLIMFKNGQVDTERTVMYVGAATPEGSSPNLRVRIQGTSTAKEFRKNMRYDSKGKVSEYRWSQEAYESLGSVNPLNGFVFSKEVSKLGIILRGTKDTEHKCTLLTTKTNYNESTSTRNLPQARWAEDAIKILGTHTTTSGELMFPDLLTPPQKKDVRVRQAIDGIPAVQFTHNLSTGTVEFTGKIDMITDKKNSAIFGFSKSLSDNDYSIETRNGGTDICCFRCPNIKNSGEYTDPSQTTKAKDNLEYRWAKGGDDAKSAWGDGIMDTGSAIQRLYDFLFNCHPDFIGFQSKNGVITRTNNNITVLGVLKAGKDNRTTRLEKFYKERKYYMVCDSMDFNGLVSKVFLWADQRGKNQFFTHYGTRAEVRGDFATPDFDDLLNTSGTTYEILRLLPYDIDTSLRGDNASKLRYDFTRLYNDVAVYNDNVDDVTESMAHFKAQSCFTSEAEAEEFVNTRILGKKSALYELLDWTCQLEYAKMYQVLSDKGMFSQATLRQYSIEYEADVYNNVIYNADTAYKYISSGSEADQLKAHGSAKEDLMWWIAGRLYFMGGEHASGDWLSTENSIYGAMALTNELDTTNLSMRDFSIQAVSRVRNWIGVKAGSGGKVKKTYAPSPGEPVEVSFDYSQISSEDNARFYIYGALFMSEILDLSKLYIKQIGTWGKCTTMKSLRFGSKTPGFNNPALTDIKGSGNPTFSLCSVVDLSNCSGYTDGDFRSFPAVEELFLLGTAVKSFQLPATNSIRVIELPDTIESIILENKTNIEEFTIDGYQQLNSLTVKNVSELVTTKVFNMLASYYG